MNELHEAVMAALKTVYDPEISVNIYDLGLIYQVNIDQKTVHIQMTLTTPACAFAQMLPESVRLAVQNVPGVEEVHVELVWDPPWDMNRLSEEAKLQLGLI